MDTDQSAPDLCPHRLLQRPLKWTNLADDAASNIYSSLAVEESTLKAPITTAADDKFCDIFPNF